MPFKLRLKKSRQYNVVSKNLFVISVELLDRSVTECTLSAESTGQDCLYNVCQRVGLHQPEFFGLRYIYKGHGLRWVEMSKPLKKQLEKFSSEFKLYLAVMFYIWDARLLYDEVTRYQYFLQLKKDIIEGELPCTAEQAIMLTSYCLQAEFGNHDPERHTEEYLKQFVLFPAHLKADSAKLQELLSDVLLAHSQLQGLISSAAEIQYIQKAQQLDGYGHEYFPAKDEGGNELRFGISVMGIVAKYQNVNKAPFYNWNDISRLTHHKKYLNIECTNGVTPCSTYQLEDAETAKYLMKLCIQQNKFYLKTKSLFSHHESGEIGHVTWRSRSLPNLQNTINHNPLFDAINPGQLIYGHEAHTVADLHHAIGLHSELPYEEYPTTYQISPAYSGNLGHGSAYSIDQLSHLSGAYTTDSHPSSSNLSLHVVQRTNSQDHEQRKALLPSYRPAPDYETAIQQKYGSLQHAQITVNEGIQLPTTSHSFESALNAFARTGHVGQGPSYAAPQFVARLPEVKSYTHYKNYDDLAHLDEEVNSSAPFNILHNGDGLVANELLGNIIFPHQHLIHQQHHMMGDWNASAINGAPPSHTYSTPELTSQGLARDLTSEHLINQVRPPPPPYPNAQRSSSSTPDLASHGIVEDRHSSVVGSSPNLIISSAAMNGIGISNSSTGFTHSPNANILHGDAIVGGNVYFPNPVQVTELTANTNSLNDGTLHQAINTEFIKSSVLLPLQDDVAVFGRPNNESPDIRSRSSSTQSAPEVMKTTNDLRQHTYSTGNSSSHGQSKQVPQKYQGKATKKGPNPGPLLVAAMNGLSLSHTDLVIPVVDDALKSKDSRCQMFENKLLEGSVFMEFEQIPKKRFNADYTTSLLPENVPRNRFKDVLPYDDNRVQLSSTKDNKTGYINASHVSVTIGRQQRFYIAAQGPLPSTANSFWQMVWEQNAQIIIMLTEVKEQGRDKCFPYWPQEENGGKVEFGDYQITRRFVSNSDSFCTSALTLMHQVQKKQRNVWHIQYTDWPDHGCPQNVHGFLSFMEEIDSVRRHAASEFPPGKSRNVPMIVHCSAGVGRSGVTILCDVMIYCLDHNENLEVPNVLTNLRQQRMLTVQTLAQYKFVYSVLIQYLKNSRLI